MAYKKMHQIQILNYFHFPLLALHMNCVWHINVLINDCIYAKNCSCIATYICQREHKCEYYMPLRHTFEYISNAQYACLWCLMIWESAHKLLRGGQKKTISKGIGWKEWSHDWCWWWRWWVQLFCLKSSYTAIVLVV